MKSDLITALESAKSLLDDAYLMTGSVTVEHEINAACDHISRAIEWAKPVTEKYD